METYILAFLLTAGGNHAMVVMPVPSGMTCQQLRAVIRLETNVHLATACGGHEDIARMVQAKLAARA